MNELTNKTLGEELGINWRLEHNINHEALANMLLTKPNMTIDILNIWNKEDYKVIMHYMLKKIHKNK